MFHCILTYRNAPHIMIVSIIVFMALNIFENIIHFSIGRNMNANKNDITDIRLMKPRGSELGKIILEMIVFAVLQGLLTYLFLRWAH